MYLSHFEYPVIWMSPERATLVVVIVELFCPVLLFQPLLYQVALQAWRPPTGASHGYFGHDDWAGFAPGP
jgi:hypothetical protein